MRTAVLLLGILGLAAIPGSLFPQRNVASDPAAVQRFLVQHPHLGPWLDRLGMFDVYASAWFAAVYLLLIVSMTGCVLPRALRLWRSARSAPAAAPRNMARLEGHRIVHTPLDPVDVVGVAAQHLRRRRFRVVASRHHVSAERGFLREIGNLAFHLSLLALLVGIAVGKLSGYEGRVAVTEGSGFANDLSQYDAFSPSAWTDVDHLQPLSFRLRRFDVAYETKGANAGQARQFAARLTYRAGNDRPRNVTVEPNHPLDVKGTKFFLAGNGYAPIITVRDGRGDPVFTGPVQFLPLDASFASDGVVKVPDARPAGLAFDGFFLPTAEVGPRGPYSLFPDTLNPQLVLTAYSGDLGLDDGVPQSVYRLDKTGLKQLQRNGEPVREALSVGQTMTLPSGRGSLTFEGVSRFANFQIAYDPGKKISLAAAMVLLVGLTASLSIRRRRIWVAARPNGSGSTVEVARLSLTRREPPPREIEELVAALTRAAPQPPTKSKEGKQ